MCPNTGPRLHTSKFLGSRYPPPTFSDPNAPTSTLEPPLGARLNGVGGLFGILTVIVSFPAGWFYIYMTATMVPTKDDQG